jgi:uncharacterized protein (TIGR03435 family)
MIAFRSSLFAFRFSLFVLAAASLSAQTSLEPPPEMAKLQFEVATVKPNKSGDQNSRLGLQPGGRVVATNLPLRALIRNVYDVQAYQIVGGADWIEHERFDFEARADREYPPSTGGPPLQLIAMMRNLLADRFKLVVHRETREMPVYALELARPDGTLGPRMRRVEVDCAAEMAKEMAYRAANKGAPTPRAPDQRPPCSMRVSPGRLSAGSASLAQLVRSLPQFVGRTVVDRTGLSGVFDIDLEWTPEQTAETTGPSLFTAVQEQLGLKLEGARGPVAVLVIDHIERPAPD